MSKKTGGIAKVAIILMAAAACMAGVVDLPGNDEGLSWRVVQSTPTRTTIEFRLGGIETSNISIQGRTFDAVGVRGLARTSEVGAPELPVLSFLLACGDGDIRATFDDMRTTRIDGILPAPCRPPSPDVEGWVPPPLRIDEAIYNSEQTYPANRFSAGERIVIHGVEGRRIEIFPIRYLPSEGAIDIAYRFNLTIEHDPPAPVPERLSSPAFERFNRRAFANPDAISFADEE